MLPSRRETGLVAQPMGDELVLIDQERNDVFRLNPVAAAIWQCCDGNTGTDSLLAAVRHNIAPGADESVVWSCLRDLSDAGLLVEPLPNEPSGISRRKLLATVGLIGGAGVIAPMIRNAVPASAAAPAEQPSISKFPGIVPGAFLLTSKTYKATFSELSNLGNSTDVVEAKFRGNDREESGFSRGNQIGLTRPLSEDQSLWKWRQAVIDAGSEKASKDMSLLIMSNEGSVVAQWNISRAWPSKIDVSEANVSSNQPLVEEITLANNGVIRVK